MIPSYDELKKQCSYACYMLYNPVIGGYFRLTINEEKNGDIALDYLQNGYLATVLYHFDSDYHYNKLYKLNKKNYRGLVDLYEKTLKILLIDTKEALKEVNKK